MIIERRKENGINIIDAKVDSSAVSVVDAISIESYLNSNVIAPAKQLGLSVKRAKCPSCYPNCIAMITVEGKVSRMQGYFHDLYLVFVTFKKPDQKGGKYDS